MRSDVLADETEPARRLSQLEQTADGDRIGLDRLGADDHRALVDRLLDLAPDLADHLAEQTEGNPLFAIQLLRDWVDRGMLVPGEDGFRLRDGAEVGVPDDIHRLWLERLRTIIERAAPERRSALWQSLECAAALGRQVAGVEWCAISRDLLGTDGEHLRDALVKRGLAARTDEGWSFAHGLLVQSLEHRARDADRWRDHHRRCAQMLDRLSEDHPQRTADRRAHHWLEAGALEEAVAPLWQTFERYRDIGDSERAEAALTRRER
ncbi:MAG: hypothetical protein ABEN55_23735, partial [Bradymonadaceae bacterium]